MDIQRSGSQPSAKQLPFDERLTGLAAKAFRALKEGRWTAERAITMNNDEFFEAIGAPYITQPIQNGQPAILKRQGCHDWRPELFAEDDFRYGWTWEHCEADARALLGGQEAVERYLKSQTEAPPSGPEPKKAPTLGKPMRGHTPDMFNPEPVQEELF